MDGQLKGSAARLWKLVEARMQPGADTTRIDARIWELFGDQRAIMFTDLVGFSRQVAQFGIIHFLQVILEQERLLLPIVEEHDGLLVKTEADSFLILFKTAGRAVECAIAMQRACQRVSASRPPEDRITLCVGIGHGPVLKIGDDDVYGHEVNLASKLGEDIAAGDEILVTTAARDATGEVAGATWEEVAVEVVNQHKYWRLRY
jgi:class 3 adenylate cyclase